MILALKRADDKFASVEIADPWNYSAEKSWLFSIYTKKYFTL